MQYICNAVVSNKVLTKKILTWCIPCFLQSYHCRKLLLFIVYADYSKKRRQVQKLAILFSLR